VFQNPVVRYALLITVAVLGLAFWLYQQWNRRWRTRTWMAAAEKLGLLYFGKRNTTFRRFAGFGLFSTGDDAEVPQGMNGTIDGTTIIVGDFYGPFTCSFCIATSERLSLPHWRVRPKETGFVLLDKMAGHGDIEIDEDREFSDAYWLQGDDETAIRALFSPELRAWFTNRQGRLRAEGREKSVLVYTDGTLLDPAESAKMIDATLELAQVVSRQGIHEDDE
jgi:hypothetical protein